MKNLLMKRRIAYLLLPLLLILVSRSFAATYYVGTCHSSSYSTISAAVAAVPPNSTIDVCPGTYPEQVFISQPLTLQGIKSGNGDRARIVVPISVGGPINWQFVPDPDGPPSLQDAPQIFVTAPTGTVKISNLTIDASGETAANPCGSGAGWWITTAIMYQDSSGTVNGVNTVGQGKNSGCGVGMRAVATASNSTSVTISNNSIQDTNYFGIYLETLGAGAILKVNVSGNSLVLGIGGYAVSAIESHNVTGTISSNSIEDGSISGISDGGGDVGPLTISNNTLHATTPTSPLGIQLTTPTAYPRTVSGNKIVDFLEGISLPGATVAATVKNNVIVNSTIGIELTCDTAVTLSGNVINNAGTGLIDVPTTFSLTGIAMYNVDKIRLQGACP